MRWTSEPPLKQCCESFNHKAVTGSRERIAVKQSNPDRRVVYPLGQKRMNKLSSVRKLSTLILRSLRLG